ncbi:site-specific DNA-methyltransferase [Paenibacillus dendritiformis]|uniref:site-specific DNA-methyltransferase n=1 Tax=Paenibacillus dendritiformis TaxID=130049 RepID=UPI0020C3DEE1|nr:site-specific DNA-methyltransferase [Paenibacillus dendritiformis]CAH8768756.1 site-specific DNA-methyltransferase [Paenibacillus dendritiformis]
MEADRYNHLNKEELIALLKKRDSSRKLGLVWERDDIEYERALNDDFVVLSLDEQLSIGEAPYENFLIEGDNFDALRFLNMTYKGRVKCIYIDPPFNLGRRDFIYNDRYIDEEDSYRHSKWLEFMYRRMILAKDLLSDDGVIFVSIGETEYAHLTLLMDQVFPNMRVTTFVWRRRSGANDSKERFVSADHEYVLCYANKGFTFSGTEKSSSSYTNPDNDSRGKWINDNLVQAKNYKQRPEAYYPVYNPATDTWYPCDPGNVWRFSTKTRVTGKKIRTKTMEQLIEEKRILWPTDEATVVYNNLCELETAIKNGDAPKNLQVYLELDELISQVSKGQAPEKLLNYLEPLENWVGRKIGYGKPRYKRFWSDLKRTEKPLSTWLLPSSISKSDLESINIDEIETIEVGYTSEGTTLLSQMLGNKDFPYPKPMSLIKGLIAQSTEPDSQHIVMDFFAGSGTTGHAVMALNDEDGGNRKYILVSSTEANVEEPEKNVCRDITSKRLRAAIEGYSYRSPKGVITVDGLGGDFAYMRASRVKRERLIMDVKHDQIWYALQQLHSNSIIPFVEDKYYQTLKNEHVHIIYIPKLNEVVLKELKTHIENSLKPTFIYSWQPGLIKQHFEITYIRIEKIPDFLIQCFGGIAR